ncbi:hypothetical protein OESDEN_19535 [Oesophagostomum dentatum]|uniref:Uncharacterized protein n=1 Tax=Oesophagostomum dentatum TaxID=61180 RepID=A0A0B1SA63_OESDE|nr:hypothetical protein OESDEN_19535 [Oesophagostomum dentatum]
MQVTTDIKPHHKSHRLGPTEKVEEEVKEAAKNIPLVSEVSASGRPADTMYDRRRKIPLRAQLMMASGPMNGPEIAYYPWDDVKETDAQAKGKVAAQEVESKG